MVSGSGRVLVVHAGRSTEFGAIAARLRLRPALTEFEQGVRRFGYLLMEITLVLVIIIFAFNVYLIAPFSTPSSRSTKPHSTTQSIRQSVTRRLEAEGGAAVPVEDGHGTTPTPDASAALRKASSCVATGSWHRNASSRYAAS